MVEIEICLDHQISEAANNRRATDNHLDNVRRPLSISNIKVFHQLNQRLTCRWADPFFGVGIGIFAFYLSERNETRPPGHSFTELCQKRFNKQYNYWIKGEPSIGPAGNKPPGQNWGLW